MSQVGTLERGVFMFLFCSISTRAVKFPLILALNKETWGGCVLIENYDGQAVPDLRRETPFISLMLPFCKKCSSLQEAGYGL